MVLIFGFVGIFMSVVYVLVKYVVVGLMKIVVLEYFREGIWVNLIGLGYIFILLFD